MKLYEITIQPTSGFGTPLKGDTIFGHFCWQAGYDSSLLEGGLQKQVDIYPERPFAVFSSAIPKIDTDNYYALRRPVLPMSILFPDIKDRRKRLMASKENKKKRWMLNACGGCIDLGSVNYLTDRELCRKTAVSGKNESGELQALFSQPHNTINRLTGTTGKNMFAPYVRNNSYYQHGVKLALFVALDSQATDIENIIKGLSMIGNWGFGRDASIGLGRFDVCGAVEINLQMNEKVNALYTLAPAVPDSNLFSKMYFNTFVRFGKHGEYLANGKNPFKNPVIMTDEAAVFVPKDKSVFNKPYTGKAITHVSKAMPGTVVQGYTPYLPLILEQEL